VSGKGRAEEVLKKIQDATMMNGECEVITVRTGKTVHGENGDRWDMMVHDRQDEDGSGEVIVAFHGTRRVVVQRFGYGTEESYFEGDLSKSRREYVSVRLSALTYACHLAAELESREWWRLRCHFKHL